MRPFFIVTLAFVAGFVVATQMPMDPVDENLASALAQAKEDAATRPAEDSDAAPVDEPPGLLAEADPEARPVQNEPPAPGTAETPSDQAVALASAELPEENQDWPQWGGSSRRNNAPRSEGIPTTWDLARVPKTGESDLAKAQNIKWVAQLGSQSYGNPVVSKGRIFVGTNNAAGYTKRYAANVDLGCLICFAEEDGAFLWQYSAEKLPTGMAHDWPRQGICCSPLVEDDALWLVTNRGEVVCLDPQGFHDDENDGPFQDEPSSDHGEADVIWSYDMMKQLGVLQHNMASCSVTALGDLLFVCTSNGIDEEAEKEEDIVPAPDAPSFLAMNKHTGELVWQDKSPGANILHGQWSSPAAAVLGGVPQVIFAGGDGWLYSFRADGGESGRGTLLWRFDCNPKDTEWVDGGRGTRNNLIGTPVIYDDKVYVAVGQDPENQEGQGHLWCVDPTRRGDVSPKLVVKKDDPDVVVPHRRERAFDPEQGEMLVDNPNSAVVWHYDQYDLNGDGDIGFEETMHRTLGTVAIADGLLFVADYSGQFHCVDAKTGRPHWIYDMLSCSWGSPLITDRHVYIGDEDGDVAVFRVDAKGHEPLAENNMLSSVYSTPIVANGVLYITARTKLFAIASQADANTGEGEP